MMVSLARIWEDAFEGISGVDKLKSGEVESEAPEMSMSRVSDEVSGVDDALLEKREEAKLECPICFEPFDTCGNAPLVLWCGHTLCKSCVLRLQRAVLKFQKLRPIVLPFFVSCPWCSSYSLKLSVKGALKFPKKNYFVLWMIHNSSQRISCVASNGGGDLSCAGRNGQIGSEELLGSNQDEPVQTSGLFDTWVILGSLRKSLLEYSQAERALGLGFLLIFVALFAARVSTLVLALYSMTALFGSAFLLLPKICLPGIGLAC